MDRRTFLYNSSSLGLGVALGAAGLSQVGCSPKRNIIGAQLYTVRDDMAKSPEATLAQVAKIGYQNVECAGYQAGKFYGMPAAAFKALLATHGLTMSSGHTQTGAHAPDQKGTMVNGWEQAVADFAAVGQEYVVCAYLHDFERKSIDDYKRIAELLNRCGEMSKQYGVQMAYHNHDFEFVPLDGQVPMDLLLAETDADLVKVELDLYWAVKVGRNPVDYMAGHPGRFPLWHVKDMDNTPEQFFTEVGNGVIDFKSIFAKAEPAGLKYFFVEQDQCRNHKPLESLAISFKNLTALRLKA